MAETTGTKTEADSNLASIRFKKKVWEIVEGHPKSIVVELEDPSGSVTLADLEAYPTEVRLSRSSIFGSITALFDDLEQEEGSGSKANPGFKITWEEFEGTFSGKAEITAIADNIEEDTELKLIYIYRHKKLAEKIARRNYAHRDKAILVVLDSTKASAVEMGQASELVPASEEVLTHKDEEAEKNVIEKEEKIASDLQEKYVLSLVSGATPTLWSLKSEEFTSKYLEDFDLKQFPIHWTALEKPKGAASGWIKNPTDPSQVISYNLINDGKLKLVLNEYFCSGATPGSWATITKRKFNKLGIATPATLKVAIDKVSKSKEGFNTEIILDSLESHKTLLDKLTVPVLEMDLPTGLVDLRLQPTANIFRGSRTVSEAQPSFGGGFIVGWYAEESMTLYCINANGVWYKRVMGDPLVPNRYVTIKDAEGEVAYVNALRQKKRFLFPIQK